MDLLTREDLKTLLAPRQSPCISIFMPTHRGGAEADPILWRKQLAKAEEQLLAAGLRTSEAQELLESGRRLLEDSSFWSHQCDGLAFFLAPQFVRVYRLPMTFEELVVVADRFHVKPLLPLLSGSGRFYVLALSQNGVRLLQGTRHSVSAVDLKGLPRNLAEALHVRDRDEAIEFHGLRPGSNATWGSVFHGLGGDFEEHKPDLLRYFQLIDRNLHPLLREERAPLVVAAVEYLLPIYRTANTYPHLLEKGLEGNPDRLSEKELHDRAWVLVQPHFEEAQQKAGAQYRQLAGTGRTASNLKEIVSAASRGQIETLFVARDQQCWGKFDPSTGQVDEHAREEPGDEDLLNVAALHTLRHGGTVYAVEPGQVPEGDLIAAVFCLPLAKRGKRP